MVCLYYKYWLRRSILAKNALSFALLSVLRYPLLDRVDSSYIRDWLESLPSIVEIENGTYLPFSSISLSTLPLQQNNLHNLGAPSYMTISSVSLAGSF